MTELQPAYLDEPPAVTWCAECGVVEGRGYDHAGWCSRSSRPKAWVGSSSEADPTGRTPHEPGAKLDAGKPDASLLQDFGRALLAVAKVGTVGALKYTRGGWRHVPDGFTRYTAAMGRHWLLEGASHLDPGGLPHAAHVAWNALARLELLLTDTSSQRDKTP